MEKQKTKPGNDLSKEQTIKRNNLPRDGGYRQIISLYFYLWRKKKLAILRRLREKPVSGLIVAIGTLWFYFIPFQFSRQAGRIVSGSEGFQWMATLFFLLGMIPAAFWHTGEERTMFPYNTPAGLFTAPLDRKALVTVHRAGEELTGFLMLSWQLVVFGILAYGVPVWKILLYLISYLPVKTLFHMAFTHGLHISGRKTPERMRRLRRFLIIEIILLFLPLAIAVFQGVRNPDSLLEIWQQSPAVLLPVFGNMIALIAVIFGSAVTGLQLLGTGLLVLFSVTFAVVAIRSETDGSFIENEILSANEVRTSLERNGAKVSRRKGNRAIFKKSGAGVLSEHHEMLIRNRVGGWFSWKFFLFAAIGIALASGGYFRPEMRETVPLIAAAVLIYKSFFVSGAGLYGSDMQHPWIFLFPIPALRKTYHLFRTDLILELMSATVLLLPVMFLPGTDHVRSGVISLFVLFVCMTSVVLHPGISHQLQRFFGIGETSALLQSVLRLLLDIVIWGIPGVAGFVALLFGVVPLAVAIVLVFGSLWFFLALLLASRMFTRPV